MIVIIWYTYFEYVLCVFFLLFRKKIFHMENIFHVRIIIGALSHIWHQNRLFVKAAVTILRHILKNLHSVTHELSKYWMMPHKYSLQYLNTEIFDSDDLYFVFFFMHKALYLNTWISNKIKYFGKQFMCVEVYVSLQDHTIDIFSVSKNNYQLQQ